MQSGLYNVCHSTCLGGSNTVKVDRLITKHLSRDLRFQTTWYGSDQPTHMRVTLLTEHHLRVLNFKGGCTGSSESTLVKMPHYWKSHVAAHLLCQHRFIDKYLGRGKEK